MIHRDIVVEIYMNLVNSHKLINPTLSLMSHETWVINSMKKHLINTCRSKIHEMCLSKNKIEILRTYKDARICLYVFNKTLAKKIEAKKFN